MLKQLLFASCFTTTLISCGSSTNGPIVASTYDTVATVDISSAPKVDRATTEQSKIAFSSMRFGMTPAEIKSLPKKDTKGQQQIGDYEYSVEKDYNQGDSLYRLRIRSESRDATYIETYVRAAHDNLVDIITAKYGAPEVLLTFPNILGFESGYIKFTRSWTVGDKIIKLGVGEEQASAEFYTEAWIYDKNMQERYDAHKESKSSKGRASDASKF